MWYDPLEQPNRKMEAVSKLKYILLDDGSASSPYAELLIELVVDPIMKWLKEIWTSGLPPGSHSRNNWYDTSWEIVLVNVFLHPWMSIIDQDLLQPMLTKQVAWPDVWNGFVDGVIIPYLKHGLGNVRNMPSPRGMAAMDAWVDHLMRWKPVVSPESMTKKVLKRFMEKWTNKICRWMFGVQPIKEEAVALCQDWMQLLMPDLLAIDSEMHNGL
ncbi:septin and tuftelin-interacting protein 1 homolog 1-like [Miscanthus floridulus]|uniref:septin and tuftelin-interacting protein 1 homolog 1-like n=1 Tax=Miscanthus floridulus TaxID=154761 RepID=UPI003459123D